MDEVFDDLVVTHRPSLLRHAVRRTGDRAAADDAVQETFIRAYRAYERLQPDARMGPWLHTILANVCVDEANRRRRESAKVDRLSGEVMTKSPGSDVEHVLGLDVDHLQLRTAMASLPLEYRDALTKRFVDELSYDELALAAGVSQQNARARVSRARSAMRVAMRGAAAMPLAGYLWLRRGRRASAAFDRSQEAALTSRAGGGGSLSRMMTNLAPALSNANTFVAGAPSAAPALGRVAVGITMVAAASISVSYAATQMTHDPPAAAEVAYVSTSANRTVPPSTAGSIAPAIIVAVGGRTSAGAVVGSTVGTDLQAVNTVESVVPGDALSTMTSTTESVPSTTVLETPTTTSPTVAIPVTASPPSVHNAPAPSSAPGTTVATVVTELVETTSTDVAGNSTTVVVDVTEPGSAVDPTTNDESSGVVPVVAPSTTSAPVAPSGGELRVAAVTVSPAGPRLDLSGMARLSTDGGSRSGSMQGRLLIDAELGADGSQRLDGSLHIDFSDGGSIDVRVAGFASVQEGGSTSIHGQFRASGDTAGLVTAGSFRGSLGTSLTLSIQS